MTKSFKEFAHEIADLLGEDENADKIRTLADAFFVELPEYKMMYLTLVAELIPVNVPDETLIKINEVIKCQFPSPEPKEPKMEFTIIESEDRTVFKRAVNKLLSKGATLHGETKFITDKETSFYFQALLVPES